MNKADILDMFFNDILPSIVKGQLEVDDTAYNIQFNVSIFANENVKYIANIHNVDLPTLIIQNVEKFSNLLLEFTNEIISRDIKWCPSYIHNSSQKIKTKYFLSLMWSNMTTSDFSNSENFIRRCIAFVRDDTFKNLSLSCEPVAILNNSHLEVFNIDEETCHSTPYIMKMAIVDEQGHRFMLPDVNYAIEEVNQKKRAYIYTIQYDSKIKVEKEDDIKYCKKINFILYKADRDIPKEELDKKELPQDTSTWDEENIVVVTRSALASLTIVMSLFAKEGITEVLVPSYFPIHWDAKSIMYERKLAYYRKKDYTEEQLGAMKKEYVEEQLRIQRNVTEKLLRSFRRVDYHFDGLEISSYPQDVDEFMHLKLDPNFKANNPEHILGQISSSIINYEKAIKTK